MQHDCAERLTVAFTTIEQTAREVISLRDHQKEIDVTGIMNPETVNAVYGAGVNAFYSLSFANNSMDNRLLEAQGSKRRVDCSVTFRPR